MSGRGTVTTWIGLLQAGEPAAAQRLWERYFPRLIKLARLKLRGSPRQVADEEDVALSAFRAFFDAVARKQIPQLCNRDHLWNTLVLITARKAIDQRRRQQSQKRGGGRIADGQPDWQELEEVVGTEPDPAFAAQITEEFQVLLAMLDDDRLREMALLKLEGYTNDEIAVKMACSPRSVTRRLAVIRRIWEDATDGASDR